ncbi:group I intron endonuclease family protein [Enterococcus phage PEf771]|uniref:Homing endonuclease n=2 Tax=Schiekvirus TaxID=2732968 RepID=A0A0C5K8V0_9CAUD|nr:homing endonuclease [Enterococcus phage EFDG1]AJP61403.1 homing endonuclease [Enterococcus phage EFDG1]QEP29488.1 group I intron endonuclease family protein [Enterococcus phage PEf771]
MIGIYLIKNNINGKCYIGQSVNIEKRVKEHFWKSFYKTDRSYECVVHQAIRKYGKENFSWEVLTTCEQKDLDELERAYIKKYNTLAPDGYNRAIGGQKNKAKIYFCKQCNNQLHGKGKTYLCKQCFEKSGFSRKALIPDKDILFNKLCEASFSAVAREYNVSDNAVRKWCKSYGLPYKATDYKNIRGVIP